MKTSKFYTTDPADPDAPRVLDEHTGPHGTIRPGATVDYDNPALPGLGSPAPPGVPLIVAELIDFGGGHPVQAVLNDGAYECTADNLRPAREFPSLEAFYNDRPAGERRYSPEADYGVHWHEGDRTWPSWQVSYVKATGEICAVESRSPFRVRVLGVIPPDDPADDPGRAGGRGRYYFTLDKVLDGWADPDTSGHDLAWIMRKLASAGRG